MAGANRQEKGAVVRRSTISNEKSVPRKPLSPELQELVDNDEYHEYAGPINSPSTPVTPYRYIAYTSQIGTILHSARRYASRACSMTEHFRSAERAYLIRGVSAISWAYAIYDVVFEGHQAYLRNRDILAPPSKAYRDARDSNIPSIAKNCAIPNAPRSSAPALGSPPVGWEDDDSVDNLEPWPFKHIPLIGDYRVVMVKRAIFHCLASIGLPTFTMHMIVKYSGGYFKSRNTLLARSCMPLGLGLLAVPFLPYLFDGPVHNLVEIGSRMANYTLSDGI
ncbi:mitochondrial 18 KDa protein-domain-containing protein [Penicillium capsulatum]|uniref:Mitochondrial fission process protein 1 n=1 Tax=Penicillium capsulatum TaxID=69766 RepID=A0A9W9IBV3_9EURO|nr:mitochondrial 18 KDa protein-domain-containing protein [Penicillium capsulatum]KAJ6136278.1 mitochondrial 18 KDa protein-domain-containing protein [Penicillium capsulatum]